MHGACRRAQTAFVGRAAPGVEQPLVGGGIEQVGVLVEDCLGPVTVVHVPVEDRHPLRPPGRAESNCRDRDVVQQAESCGTSRRRVVSGWPRDRKRDRKLPAGDRQRGLDRGTCSQPCGEHGSWRKVGVGVDPAAATRVKLVERRKVFAVVDGGDRVVIGWSGRSDGQLSAAGGGAGLDTSRHSGEPLVSLGMARSRVSLHGRIGQKQHPVARTVAILEPGGLWHVRAHRRMSRMMSSDSSKSAYITEPRMA